jgi:hypothetical protein
VGLGEGGAGVLETVSVLGEAETPEMMHTGGSLCWRKESE